MNTRLFRIVRTILLLLVIYAVAAVAVVYGLSEWYILQRHPIIPGPVPVLADAASLARGEHLYRITTCGLCHGTDGGGAIYADAGPIGLLAGPNLTRGRGGIAGSRNDTDWVRAIRHGVRQDGSSLIVMPSEVFTHLTDQDLGALLGYIQQLPPVNREVPPTHFRWLGRSLLVIGRLDILVAPKTLPHPPRDVIPEGPTPEYGRYLANISGCHGCHGYGLSGGAVAGPSDLPPASNLTPKGLTGWTDAMFTDLMRNGRRGDGSIVHPFMPWKEFAHMTDDELMALWLYLQSVPPKDFGGK